MHDYRRNCREYLRENTALCQVDFSLLKLFLCAGCFCKQAFATRRAEMISRTKIIRAPAAHNAHPRHTHRFCCKWRIRFALKQKTAPRPILRDCKITGSQFLP